ncbi:MAG: TetM/TetW/TetO/TetS family tetracycline resistance ribosomal protection protein [Clostridia bacterium]|nr:TetM/TetW/TetO/TetS family tetracycline resistance ribosomal protection protein [Clostridia bacterium]
MHKNIGILAHVDAGKTTLSEQVLYHAHATRKVGRVDHGDAFLDTHPIERKRGVTIFSGVAHFDYEGDSVCWLDTPGHADFSTEMERTLSVLDFAVVVISCAEGVQSHTETVWSLLESYRIPTFIFINKTDRPGANQEAVIESIRRRLSGDAVDIRSWMGQTNMPEDVREQVAERDEELLERLFDGGYDADLWLERLQEQILCRACFPIMSGSALNDIGIAEFLQLLSRLTVTHHHQRENEPCTARVFRIKHDAKGARVVFLKLLSGRAAPRDVWQLPGGESKLNELRIYHGDKYTLTDSASAGEIIAVPGLPGLVPGDTYGSEEKNRFLTAPMMASDLIWDTAKLPVFRMMEQLRPLAEEEPSLHFVQHDSGITCQVMGKLQLEILSQLMEEAVGMPVSFGPCRVIYKETVAAPTVGIGHYEPLRHYAEAVLRLVPGEPGSGITFKSLCHVDTLALNWQRLIETHIFERPYAGVLTGAELTDVRVELLCGRAHLKHTEGGDFRQAVGRAMRNALMFGESVLLEPVCAFSVTAPAELYGTVAGSLSAVQAETEAPVYLEDVFTLTGTAPWAQFSKWQEDFAPMTHGRGSLRVWMSHYAPCRNPQPVIDAANYNPLAQDTPDSVFCDHGAGLNVAWYQARQWAHCQGPWFEEGETK